MGNMLAETTLKVILVTKYSVAGDTDISIHVSSWTEIASLFGVVRSPKTLCKCPEWLTWLSDWHWQIKKLWHLLKLTLLAGRVIKLRCYGDKSGAGQLSEDVPSRIATMGASFGTLLGEEANLASAMPVMGMTFWNCHLKFSKLTS